MKTKTNKKAKHGVTTKATPANPPQTEVEVIAGAAEAKVAQEKGQEDAPPGKVEDEEFKRPFFPPSQPLLGPADQPEPTDPPVLKPKAPQDIATETPLVPVVVMPSEQVEMNSLYEEIKGAADTFLFKGLRLGELLTQKKAQLGHGKFRKWAKANLTFKSRTSQKYMALYRNRMLLTKSASGGAHLKLSEAYDVIAKLSAQNKPKAISDAKKVAANKTKNTTEPENGGEADAELTPEQSAQVLGLIKEMDIAPALYASLSAHGGMIRLTATTQEQEINNHTDVSAEGQDESK